MLRKPRLGMPFVLLLILLCGIPSIHPYAKETKMDAEEEAENDVIDQESKTAQANDMNLVVSYGVRGNVRRGRNLPVKVTVSNNGEDFSGTIRVYFKENETRNRYQKDFMLASGETKDVSFLIPTKSIQPTILVSLVDDKNKELVSEKCRIGSLSNLGDVLYVGVFSNEQDRLSYLRQDDNRVFFLKNYELPDDALYMEAYDLLIIDGYQTGEFTPEQYEAIRKWVESGGTLVLGTGTAGSKVWEMFQDDFVSGTMGEVQTAELSFGIDETNQKRYVRDVLTMDLQDAEAIYTEAGHNILQKIERGWGNVLVFATDLNVDAKDVSTLGARFQTWMKENVSDRKKRQINQNNNVYSQDQFMFRQMLSGMHNNKLPNVQYYAAVLIVYIVLVGPVLYLALKKKDKRKYLWIGISSLSLCFGVLIYLMGFGTRIRNPFLGYVDYLRLSPGGNMGTEEVYCNVKVPYSGTYRLDFAQSLDVQNYGDDYYKDYIDAQSENNKDLKDYDKSFEFSGDGTSVELKELGAFEGSDFIVKKEYRGDGRYDCDFQFNDGMVTGDFTNNLGFGLTDVMMYDNRSLVYVGEVSDGGTASINENNKRGSYFTSNYNDGNVFLSEILEYDYMDFNNQYNEAGKKYYAIMKFIADAMEESTGDGFLFGFSNQETDVLANETIKENGLQLVILPIEVDYTTDEGVFVPNIDVYLTSSQGAYDGLANRFVYDESVSITYRFGTNHIMSLSYREEYNPEFDIKGNPGGLGWYGVVSAYDWGKNAYVPIFTHQTAWEVTDLTPYVNSENKMTLKYTPDNTKMQSSGVTLPYISAVLKPW